MMAPSPSTQIRDDYRAPAGHQHLTTATPDATGTLTRPEPPHCVQADGAGSGVGPGGQKAHGSP